MNILRLNSYTNPCKIFRRNQVKNMKVLYRNSWRNIWKMNLNRIFNIEELIKTSIEEFKKKPNHERISIFKICIFKKVI